MTKWLKYLLYSYLVALALYVTFKELTRKRFGELQVLAQPVSSKCFNGAEDWSFCVYNSSLDIEGSYLYVFHGKDQDEKFWSKTSGYSAQLEKYWNQYQMKHPKVVTISFGPLWLLTGHSSEQKQNLMQRMVSEVIPRVEANLGVANRGRMLLGASMGGLNALALMVQKTNLFYKVASLCPPLYKLSPYSSWMQWGSFTAQSGAYFQAVFTAVAMGRHFFDNSQEWEAFNPLTQIEGATIQGAPPALYLSAGIYDEYGLFEGVESFASRASQRGLKVHWHPHSGEHCAADIPSLARFLSTN